MNILVVTPWLPSPRAMAGAPRAIFDRVALLARDHAVTVVALIEPGDRSSIGDLEQLGTTLTAIVRQRPEPSVWATCRKRARLAVGLVTDRRPLLVQELGDPGMCRVLRRITAEHAFDAVFVEHLLAARHIDCLGGRSAARVILTDHDVQAAFPNGDRPEPAYGPGAVGRFVGRIDQRRWRAYARWAYGRAALVTVPTPEDAAVISSEVPSGRVQVVPFGLTPATEPRETGPAQMSPALPVGDSVLFVGNFDHAPNREAARWLCTAVMPSVWARRPDARVWLVGRAPTGDVQALAGERVVVTGEVPSVDAYVRAATVFAATVREGGGIRMKTLEALATGAAVVTTSIGARGLGGRSGEHLLVADDAEQIADDIVRVLDDPTLRARLMASGLALVADDGDRARRAEALARVLGLVAAGDPAAETEP